MRITKASELSPACQEFRLSNTDKILMDFQKRPLRNPWVYFVRFKGEEGHLPSETVTSWENGANLDIVAEEIGRWEEKVTNVMKQVLKEGDEYTVQVMYEMGAIPDIYTEVRVYPTGKLVSKDN